jgi:hypothetical protein
MLLKAFQHMEKKDCWKAATKNLIFATDMNGNLSNIEKSTWILLTDLKKESS